MKGASGKYDGSVVKETGTVIGPVKAVLGNTVVAKTTPGRMLPTGEPMPGKKAAVPKLPVPPPVAAPSVKVQPAGHPVVRTLLAAPTPNVPAVPPTKGNCTNGWLKAGRNTDCPVKPLRLVTGPPSTMAGGLPNKEELKKTCEFGR